MTFAATAAPQSASFAALGTTATITCTDQVELAAAVEHARRRLTELTMVASRFRPDSELAQINARSARWAHRFRPGAPLRIEVGDVLAACLGAALRAERLTQGLVSAQLGADLAACGYDDDLQAVWERDTAPPAPRGIGRRAPGPLMFDQFRALLILPAGIALDLGATAKAWAADVIAAELATRGTGGFLVNLGGDVAAAGPAPEDGWVIGIRDWTGKLVQSVHSTGHAFATSSVMVRRWRHDGVEQHHILDPRTGRPARSRWAQVSCAGPDAVQANAASTAAIILDSQSPQWLRGNHVPACLIDHRGRRTVTRGWPSETGDAGGDRG
ncbi:FAD:protein FMN transferase [Gordonia sp. X0973]|uniref:FAD:protein FMN transferase n=1 Tax=Gordonia sp. X0973 TaxID=2742602 RepID=UPI000F534969|nr:FAD:protein FMN transferase [Gordonia sp. X0973]QKT07690.1 FAD:protein FMN transferase [Gordonia sp. X0973]